MKRIAFIGFGALGRQILGMLPVEGEELLFFDDQLAAQGEMNSYPFNDYIQDHYADCEFYLGLGYKTLGFKRDILHELLRVGRQLPNLIHPSCEVHPTARVEPGAILFPRCNIGEHVVVKGGALLNNSVTVSHDGEIGECAYLSPGVVLSGFVTVGAGCFLGTGVVVANNLHIGEGSVIGLGSVVSHELPAHTSAIGNPLRVLDNPLRLN